MHQGSSRREEQAARLATARRAAGFKTPSEAVQRFGWKVSTYMAHENGQNGLRPEPAMAYAKAFNVDPGWLLTGLGSGPAQSGDKAPMDDMSANANIIDPLTKPIPEVTFSSQATLTIDKISVMGMAECGPDGWAVFNGEVVDRVDRPANLAGAKDAYAVFIIGDSMEDRYHPGEIAFIHPKKPVTPGAYVLVQRKPKHDGDTPLAVIKRFVKRTGDRVILAQLNPPKQITIPVGEIVSMHRVVGSTEA